MKQYKKPSVSIITFESEDILSASSPVKMNSLSDAYQGEDGYDIKAEGFELDWNTLY